MLRLLTLGLLALPLAACNGDHGNVSFSMNGTADDGNSASLSLDLPGMKGRIDIPRPDIQADDFKLNGVPLYPGSKIGKFNLNVTGSDKKDDGKGVVEIGFTSPASIEKVQTYFRERLNKAGFTLHDKGSSLSGKTDEGKPFSIDLTPDGADKTTGKIRVEG